MAKNPELSSEIRKRIQDSMERAQEERKREMFRRRLEIARSGLAYYEQKKIKEAVQQFHLYLRILEEGKKVPDGGLNPTYFDQKQDVHELLLISGVYWDLAKIYDRTQSEEKKELMVHYLGKFVTFAKGMAYQPLCAETIRKYIANEKTIHKQEFKEAYIKLTGGKCFVATAIAEELQPATLPRLYFLKDHVLRANAFGRIGIFFYYRLGPYLAAVVCQLPRALRKRLARFIDWIALSFT